MEGLYMGGMETVENTLNNHEMLSYEWVHSASLATCNEKGNSVMGMKALELLTTETEESIF